MTRGLSFRATPSHESRAANSDLGKILTIIGLTITVIGAMIWLLGDKLSFFGSLPGDIKIETENVRFYFPITTMILVSILLSLAMWFFSKLFH